MKSRYRWFVLGVFFAFMLLHQADKLMIGPLTTPIMETFGITKTQMGTVFTGALLVGAIFYPLWGYFYDRYARSKLLALASLLWGTTTWLSALAPSYPLFMASRASTGVDDSSYPGLYSLASDYFEPRVRGRVYAFLQISMPLGYIMGMVLAAALRDVVGWRGVFYITGTLGVLLAGLIFFGVREAPRGQSEPELADLEEISTYRFDWQIARQLFTKPSLRLLFIQGFFGVFPWQTITYWFFNYLETERGYSTNEATTTMAVAVLVLALGYIVGGSLGDLLFKRTPRGRVLVAIAGVVLGMLLIVPTLYVPVENQTLFLILLSLTAIFLPFSSPNVTSTVCDVTLPEVRSTAMAIQYFIESAGAATAPLLAGWIADRSSLQNAILIICVSTWALCALFYSLVALWVPRDIAALRQAMRERAAQEREKGAKVRRALA